MSNIHPGLILMATGILCLLSPYKLRKWIAAFGPVLALAAVFGLNESSSLTYRFTSKFTMDLLHVDSLAWAFVLVFCIIACLAGIYSFSDEDRGEKGASLIYAGSSIAVVLSGDWISLICFWEVMALASTYVVWAGRTHQARRASYRYLVMHLLGGNLLLAGAIVLCINGSWEIELLTGGSGYGYWFVLLGVAVNAAIPPLHTWAPDAYPEATSSGTVYLGSYTTKVAIYALIRLFAGTEELVLVGGIMAVFGACMALMENDIKRLLSYHIVSQLGMMVAALGCGNDAGIDGAALHALFNIMYKGVLLMGAGAIFKACGTRKISELGGLAKKMPVVSASFLIASLSIAGVPFFNGFASKALVMEALHEGHFDIGYWLVMAAGVGTWLSITLKINWFAFFKKPERDIPCAKVPIQMQIAMVIGAVLCVVTGVFPDFCYSLMPGQTMAHPFSPEHILEYVGLFIGATVPFVVLRKKMEPHDTITLDFDLFYRRAIPPMLNLLSESVFKLFSRLAITYNNFMIIVKHIVKHPNKIFDDLENLKLEAAANEDEEGRFEGEMPVGAFMQIFIIFCIVAFILVLIIE